MNLGAEVMAALPELRAMAETEFTDTFAAYSPAAKITNADGYKTDGWTNEGDTLGKVQGSSAASRDTNVRTASIGGVDRPVIEGGLHIPISSPLPQIGWEYELTELGPVSDPALLSRRYRVVDVPAKSFATARRLDVVDVTGV